jgi:general secretion pathway protein D
LFLLLSIPYFNEFSVKIFCILGLVTLVVGCDNLVKTKYLSKNVKEDSINNLATPIYDEEETKIPEIQEPQATIPEELNQKASLLLNENLSVKSVLYETAKRLNINFQMEPAVDSRIIFQAKDKPFIEILDAVCDMADLRYTISRGLVKVERDAPYSATYDVQFLNLSRDSENKISITTEVNSSSGNGLDVKDNPQSDSNVLIKAKSDFWSELEEGLKIIVGAESKDVKKYSVNKQAGIVTILGNSKTQRNVKEYITKIKDSTMSQVLIEAKIIEVYLKNEYRRGINWGLLSGRFRMGSGSFNNSGNGINNIGSHGEAIKFMYDSSRKGYPDMNTIVGALEEFGSTRTISNPRITAMNNQAAVLKVAQNHVYFKLNYEKNYVNDTNNRQEVSVSSDIKTVPLGLVMFVQPSIDMSTRTVTLFLRPTITKLASSVNDPAVNIAMKNSATGVIEDGDRSKIPITEVREVASILKLNDGEVAVLGGFMEVRSSKNKSGIPGFKDIPIAGELVSSNGMGDEIVELVILIKVKLTGGGLRNQRAADIRLQRFVPDPRPF